MRKKVLSVFMAVILLLGFFSIPVMAMTKLEFDSKLAELKKTYYQGKQQSTYDEGWACFVLVMHIKFIREYSDIQHQQEQSRMIEVG